METTLARRTAALALALPLIACGGNDDGANAGRGLIASHVLNAACLRHAAGEWLSSRLKARLNAASDW